MILQTDHICVTKPQIKKPNCQPILPPETPFLVTASPKVITILTKPQTTFLCS